jgi:hypothetical protein
MYEMRMYLLKSSKYLLHFQDSSENKVVPLPKHCTMKTYRHHGGKASETLILGSREK